MAFKIFKSSNVSISPLFLQEELSLSVERVFPHFVKTCNFDSDFCFFQMILVVMTFQIKKSKKDRLLISIIKSILIFKKKALLINKKIKNDIKQKKHLLMIYSKMKNQIKILKTKDAI